jgi:hypothetical protein
MVTSTTLSSALERFFDKHIDGGQQLVEGSSEAS